MIDEYKCIMRNPTHTVEIMVKELDKEIRDGRHSEKEAGPFPDEFYADMHFDEKRLKVLRVALSRLKTIDKQHEKAVK